MSEFKDSGLNLDHLEALPSLLREVLARHDQGEKIAMWSTGCGQKPDALMKRVRASLTNQPAPTVPAGDALRDWKLGQWFDAQTLDEMQAFYLSRLPAIRAAAAEHGYAIGLHGSERRDFDLMAMQWRDGASDKDTLARAIADAACGIRREGAYDWEQKSSGRLATSIPVCWTAHDNPDFDKPSVGHIDLSLIAHQPAQEQAEPIYQARSPEEDAWQDVTAEVYQHADSNGFEVRKLYPSAQQEPVAAPQQIDAAEKAAAYDDLNRIAVLHGFASAAAAIAAARRAAQLDGGQEGSAT